MKKLILSMAMLAITVGSGVASADRVYVPWSLHNGTGDYTLMYITNLSSAATQISVSFIGGSSETGASSMTSNTQTGTTSTTATIAGNTTWEILSRESALLATTTSVKRALITVQSSASNDPTVGSVSAWAFFVHVNGAAPSGFMFPANYQVRSYNWHSSVAGGAPGLVGNATTVVDWRQ